MEPAPTRRDSRAAPHARHQKLKIKKLTRPGHGRGVTPANDRGPAIHPDGASRTQRQSLTSRSSAPAGVAGFSTPSFTCQPCASPPRPMSSVHLRRPPAQRATPSMSLTDTGSVSPVGQSWTVHAGGGWSERSRKRHAERDEPPEGQFRAGAPAPSALMSRSLLAPGLCPPGCAVGGGRNPAGLTAASTGAAL